MMSAPLSSTQSGGQWGVVVGVGERPCPINVHIEEEEKERKKEGKEATTSGASAHVSCDSRLR